MLKREFDVRRIIERKRREKEEEKVRKLWYMPQPGFNSMDFNQAQSEAPSIPTFNTVDNRKVEEESEESGRSITKRDKIMAKVDRIEEMFKNEVNF